MNRRAALTLSAVGLAALTVAATYFAIIASRDRESLQPFASPAPARDAPPRQGWQAPVFSAPRFGGGSLRLVEFRGKGVVLNFFASWCVPCRLEAHDLEAMYQRYRARGIIFLGVNVQQDDPEDAREFLRQFGTTYPAVRDITGEIARNYRLFGLPTTYFIDKTGLVRSQFSGGFLGEAGVRELERRIREIIP